MTDCPAVECEVSGEAQERDRDEESKEELDRLGYERGDTPRHGVVVVEQLLVLLAVLLVCHERRDPHAVSVEHSERD